MHAYEIIVLEYIRNEFAESAFKVRPEDLEGIKRTLDNADKEYIVHKIEIEDGEEEQSV